MPLAGLTSEASSGPSELWIAVLRESINAVTCGSAQIFVEPEGAADVNVAVGIVVNGSVVAVAMDGDEVSVLTAVGISISVAGGSGVGVGGNVVGDAAHAAMMAVSTANPNRSTEKLF